MGGTSGGVLVDILNRGGSGANAVGDGNWVGVVASQFG